jgi:2-dehydro-3-deoxyphosphogluconate aldolase/(4S)-4-hydroxy-2-oxoglutarate aldolase
VLGLANLEVRLRSSTVLPVLRAGSASDAIAQVERCVAAGLDVIELTTSTADWVVALREAIASFPDQTIGLGTVLDASDAETAASLGVAFIVSPCPAPDVRRIVTEAGVAMIEGGMTIGEVIDASNRGLAKLFPAGVVGQGFLRSLLQIRPAARVIPTGGIALGDVASWINAGALAVGVGRELFASPDLNKTITEIKTSKKGEPQ